MEKKINCETCIHYLSGNYDFCAINTEEECGKGDYELWEEKE